MKPLFALAFSLFTAAVFGQKSQKWALLVAVGDYPPESGWMKIHSENDVDLVKNALLEQGFRAENIAVAADRAATRAGILAAFQTQILDRVGEGDVVFFQFSGHGQQVADDDGDELDGFDEAIVPFDSPMRYGDGNAGQNLIRDEELGGLFDRARHKIGPSGNLVAVLDACHSGTGTRGFGIARGTDRPMADSNFVARHRGAGGENEAAFRPKNEANLAPMAAFFGASANQLNFEFRDDAGRPCGSLTYAFCKKLALSGPKTSYRELFDAVRTEMATIAPRQSPQAEGQLDHEIFGGQAVEKAQTLRVLRWENSTAVTVSEGWMHGLGEGSIVGFFSKTERDFERAAPIFQGRVAQSRPFESTVELENEVDRAAALDAKGIVLEKNFGDLAASVRLDLPDGPLRQKLDEKMARLPIFRQNEAAPQLFIAQNVGSRGAATIALTDAQGQILEEIGPNLPPEAAAERLLKKMLAFAQADFLRQLEAQSPALDVHFEIVPIDLDRRSGRSRELPISEKTDGYGQLHFRSGDAFRVRVRNDGERAAFFTLLDIQPDGGINILAPDGSETPDEMRVAAGQTVTIPRDFELSPPLGMELFKLVATEKAVDLRPIASTRGEGTKAAAGSLERLFAQSFCGSEVQSRGGKTASVAAGAMTVRTLAFLIE